jgi:hypothetical protein
LQSVKMNTSYFFTGRLGKKTQLQHDVCVPYLSEFQPTKRGIIYPTKRCGGGTTSKAEYILHTRQQYLQSLKTPLTIASTITSWMRPDELVLSSSQKRIILMNGSTFWTFLIERE